MKKTAAMLTAFSLLAAPVAFGHNVKAMEAATGQTKVVPIMAEVKQQVVETKDIRSESEALVAEIKLPKLQGLADLLYQEQTNGLIESHAMKDLAYWKAEAEKAALKAKEAGITFRPYQLHIGYELKSDGGEAAGGIVSLVVTTYAATGGTGNPRVDTYNFYNKPDTKRLELQDVLGNGYKETVNVAIREQIAKEPAKYFVNAFEGISDHQAFYVNEGDVVIVFPKYSIAPGATGVPEFRIAVQSAANVPTITLSNADVFTSDTGKLMLPLRAVSEALGYRITWNAETGTAELLRGAQWTSVTVGKDAYTVNKMAPITLGAAPVIQTNGSMYVPSDFFTSILKAEVSTVGDSASMQIHIRDRK